MKDIFEIEREAFEEANSTIEEWEKNGKLLDEIDKECIRKIIRDNNLFYYAYLDGKNAKEEDVKKIINKLEDSDDFKLLNKNQIMEMLNCESQKALNILKFCNQNKGFECIKLGREYYISIRGWKKFLKNFDGKQLNI